MNVGRTEEEKRALVDVSGWSHTLGILPWLDGWRLASRGWAPPSTFLVALCLDSARPVREVQRATSKVLVPRMARSAEGTRISSDSASPYRGLGTVSSAERCKSCPHRADTRMLMPPFFTLHHITHVRKASALGIGILPLCRRAAQ